MQCKVIVKVIEKKISLGTSFNYKICNGLADEPPLIITIILMIIYGVRLLRLTVVMLK